MTYPFPNAFSISKLRIDAVKIAASKYGNVHEQKITPFGRPEVSIYSLMNLKEDTLHCSRTGCIRYMSLPN
jgi:hypothetical protein